ncbi:MAG: hypothetical protein KF732_09580 [Flavobacteriales bacterium]|nr:hypothetical protein [Flavobacteriales bacterium]MBX2960194.1 hypothetical protein [Flavobacteriales bacterium]
MKIYETLLKEKIEFFRDSFINVSKQMFWDDEKNKLIHPGEYGTYREFICKDFLKFLVPRRLKIDQGFIINTDKISTQCDIIIYDANATPLIENNERQKFFPVETVCAIGEVKSKLSKKKFIETINKLAKNKRLGEHIKNPVFIKQESKNIDYEFNPKEHPYDNIFSFLICEKLDFDIKNIEKEISSYYKSNEYYQRHNIILSIKDGVLLYYDKEGNDKAYPIVGEKGEQIKNRFYYSKKEEQTHIMKFAYYIFQGTSAASILYPQFDDYININSKKDSKDEK